MSKINFEQISRPVPPPKFEYILSLMHSMNLLNKFIAYTERMNAINTVYFVYVYAQETARSFSEGGKILHIYCKTNARDVIIVIIGHNIYRILLEKNRFGEIYYSDRSTIAERELSTGSALDYVIDVYKKYIAGEDINRLTRGSRVTKYST